MDKFVAILLAVLLTIGGGVWLFNNDDGLNDAAENGGKSVNAKVSQFDYSGTVAPGSGHDSEWIATPANND